MPNNSNKSRPFTNKDYEGRLQKSLRWATAYRLRKRLFVDLLLLKELLPEFSKDIDLYLEYRKTTDALYRVLSRLLYTHRFSLVKAKRLNRLNNLNKKKGGDLDGAV